MTRLRSLHWVEYGLEAFGLGLFMVSACGFGVLLFHPSSPVVRAVPGAGVRQALMGLAMGLTGALNVYAPWGRRSGSHLNPAATLTFFRMGKLAGRDALGYIAGQFLGGLAGTLLAARLLEPWIADPKVAYVVTVPGRFGAGAAFLAEAAISWGLFCVVLTLLARERWAPYTGLAAAAMVASYITLEAPISGMSMNPARTLASAAVAMRWTGLWIYFVAPPLGMLAALAMRRRRGGTAGHCAKYLHDPRYRCIFCEWRAGREPA